MEGLFDRLFDPVSQLRQFVEDLGQVVDVRAPARSRLRLRPWAGDQPHRPPTGPGEIGIRARQRGYSDAAR